MKSFRYLLLSVLAGLTISANAQTEGSRQPQPPVQAQPVQPAGKNQVRVAADSGNAGARLERTAKQLASELGLDDAQRAKYDELVAKYKDIAAQQPNRNEEVRTLVAEMREAKQAGNEQRVQEIQQQLRQPRSGNESLAQFFDEVEPLLREDQAQKLTAYRERMVPGRPNNVGGRTDRIIEDLRDKLQLDAGQQAKFDELVAEIHKQNDRQREKFAEMRPLIEQIRDAKQRGDDAKAHELEEQLRGMQGDRGEIYQKFLADLEGILREDQKPALEQYRQRFEAVTQGRRAGGDASDVRGVLQAARKLKLTEEQSKKYKEIERTALQATREVRANDTEGRAALAEKTKEEIKALLDEKQVKQFEGFLKGGRPARGERIAPPSKPNAPAEKQPQPAPEPGSAPEKP